MTQDNTQTVARSAWMFLSGTFVSRVSGLLRDLSMAFCFGSHPTIAAFMVAFRFAYLFRRLFGEGAIASTFIPHFESQRKQDLAKGAASFRDLFYALSLILILLIVITEIGLGGWVYWGSMSADTREILSLTLWMMPGVLFISLFGLNSALLQCEKQFFLTGVAPVAFNLVWVAVVWMVRSQPPIQAVYWLSIGVVAAFFLQWMMTLPPTLRYLRQLLSWKDLLRFYPSSTEINKLLKPFLLGILGIGAVQINTALDGVFARFASLEGPAYLWYAIRIEQLPLALFGIALSTALLPPLARAIKAEAWEQYRHLLHFSLSRSFNLIFPCAVALFILGASGINLLYGRGDFTTMAAKETILCLWGYGIGLVPSVFVLLLAPAFFARKDYRTPALASFYSVLVNSGLNALMVFAFGWGAFSIAVATSVAAFFNCAYLSHKLSQKIGPLFDFAILQKFFKTIVCGIGAGTVALSLGYFVIGDPTLQIALGGENILLPRRFLEQGFCFALLCGSFAITLVALAWLLNAEELLALVGLRKNPRSLSNE